MQSLNDIRLEVNKPVYDRLRSAGVDHLLAQHMAHLWIRDPLVIYGTCIIIHFPPFFLFSYPFLDNHIEIDDEENTDHFENIQSTNWQTVRFKPPPPHSLSVSISSLQFLRYPYVLLQIDWLACRVPCDGSLAH